MSKITKIKFRDQCSEALRGSRNYKTSSTLSLGDDFTPQEEVNIPCAVMVNPRILAPINTQVASDNYIPNEKPLFDRLVRDTVAVLMMSTASTLTWAQTQQTAATCVLVKNMVTKKQQNMV